MSDDRKRKSKSWYRKQAFHNKRLKTDGTLGHRLAPGQKGFIITCNDREREAVKESYNILNEYADQLYGPEAKETEDSDKGSDTEDIEKAMEKEVQMLKDAASKGERRFQNSRTGTKNCIFIKTNLEDPAGLAHTIFVDLLKTKAQKSRYALRLLPVVGTCKANLKEITELAEAALEPFFANLECETTFIVTFKARNNSGLGREMTISTLRNAIMETFSSPLLQYTTQNPQITVLVEIMCGVACLAVAREFAKFRKYNLLEVVSEKQTSDASGADIKNIIASEGASVDDKDATDKEERVCLTPKGNVEGAGITEESVGSTCDCNPEVSSQLNNDVVTSSEHTDSGLCREAVEEKKDTENNASQVSQQEKTDLILDQETENVIPPAEGKEVE